MGTFSPVNRWKSKLSAKEIATFEALVGDCLKAFDYMLATEGQTAALLDPGFRLMRTIYPGFFSLKLFLRSKTLAGRLAKGTRLELTD